MLKHSANTNYPLFPMNHINHNPTFDYIGLQSLGL